LQRTGRKPHNVAQEDRGGRISPSNNEGPRSRLRSNGVEFTKTAGSEAEDQGQKDEMSDDAKPREPAWIARLSKMAAAAESRRSNLKGTFGAANTGRSVTP